MATTTYVFNPSQLLIFLNVRRASLLQRPLPLRRQQIRPRKPLGVVVQLLGRSPHLQLGDVLEVVVLPELGQGGRADGELEGWGRGGFETGAFRAGLAEGGVGDGREVEGGTGDVFPAGLKVDEKSVREEQTTWK